ncbi:MAG: ABC transporter ATP-binding protein [Janthinobacterium lividum]
MSSDSVAIRISDLGKCYEIYGTPRDRLKQFVLPRFFRWLGKKAPAYFREFWALKDVSFEVHRGQTVGIIGRNGAGKSTLLQVLCGTLNPTGGSVEITGRVAALLELGAGFSGEFTGRENVYLNAGVLGLSTQEIEERFDRIVAFADIGDFLDQPVKTYSSGMYVRLAFAVVIHVDADILIVDEALAVGDIAFQAKCMVELKRLMDNGATVLFVSHDTSSVRNLCQKVLWLEGGKVRAFGEPESILGAYVAEAHLSTNAHLAQMRVGATAAPMATEQVQDPMAGMEPYITFAKGWRRYGDGRARVQNVVVLNGDGMRAETLVLREKFVIRFVISASEDVGRLAIGFSFKDLKGNQVVSSLTSNYRECTVPDFIAGRSYVVEIAGENVLTQGIYTLTLGVESVVDNNRAHEYLDVVENIVTFQSSFGGDAHDIFPGMVWQPVDFSVATVGAEVAPAVSPAGIEVGA